MCRTQLTGSRLKADEVPIKSRKQRRPVTENLPAQRIVLTFALIVRNILWCKRFLYFTEGNVWQSLCFKGKSTSRRSLNASKEKSCQKEKALNVRRDFPACFSGSQRLSKEAPFEGHFHCLAQTGVVWGTHFC